VAVPLLEIRGLSKRFGGVLALDGLDLTLAEGQIRGLIGPNGAGKSTFFNVVTGALPADAGEIRFAGRRVNGLRPHALVRLGMVRTFQKVHPFLGMTVLESAMVGCHAVSRAGLLAAVLRPPPVAREEARIRETAEAALEFVGLGARRNELAETLPLGLQRLLQLACAIATGARLLLLDESASGLTAAETDRLAVLLDDVRGRGKTIVLVEHDMSLVMRVSDEITVLNFGRKLAEASPAEVRRHPDVIRAYLGGGGGGARG
jgi:branched-chain amino acid transport system ATP-binding protein